MSMLAYVLVPLHPDGRKFVAAFAVASALLFVLWAPLGWLGLALTLWCYYFFRDPVRAVPDRAGLVVSPADGRVASVAETAPPAELELGEGPRTRVGIFMSVFDCHVNRAPADGTVARQVYCPGRFVNASLDKASEENERSGMVLALDDGRELGVVQIAGLVARRIVGFVETGQHLRTGERFGLIRFGSRLDVYLPPGVAPLVAPGQTMVAGETVIADLAGEEPARQARAE